MFCCDAVQCINYKFRQHLCSVRQQHFALAFRHHVHSARINISWANAQNVLSLRLFSTLKASVCSNMWWKYFICDNTNLWCCSRHSQRPYCRHTEALRQQIGMKVKNMNAAKYWRFMIKHFKVPLYNIDIRTQPKFEASAFVSRTHNSRQWVFVGTCHRRLLTAVKQPRPEKSAKGGPRRIKTNVNIKASMNDGHYSSINSCCLVCNLWCLLYQWHNGVATARTAPSSTHKQPSTVQWNEWQ